MIAGIEGLCRSLSGARRRHHHGSVVRRRVESPTRFSKRPRRSRQFDAPEDLASDGKALYIADGGAVLRLDGTVTTEVRRFDRTIISAVLPAWMAASPRHLTGARCRCSRRLRRPAAR